MTCETLQLTLENTPNLCDWIQTFGLDADRVKDSLSNDGTEDGPGLRFYGVRISGEESGHCDIPAIAAAAFNKDEHKEFAVVTFALYVRPETRRMGFGRDLLIALERAAKDFGSEGLLLSLDETNSPDKDVAKAFVTACGYNYKGVLEGYDFYAKQDLL